MKEKFIKWDSKSFPLIWRKGTSRKITHREIARLKGIPDDYLEAQLDNMMLILEK